jgi:hypothetical protein
MTYMRSWKSHRLTSRTWLGLNPQIGRPLSRIVVPLVKFFRAGGERDKMQWQKKSTASEQHTNTTVSL